MSDLLNSPRLKIERAEKHYSDLESNLETYIRGKPFEMEVTRVADEQFESRLVVREEVPPELSAIAGDVLHNLRSALDHLAWALVLQNGGSPGRHTSFPILPNAKKIKRVTRKRLAGAGDEAIRLIERLKPYDGGIQEFWILGCLDNVDKHRLLLTLASSNPYVRTDLESGWRKLSGLPLPDEFPRQIVLEMKPRCLEPGALLMTMKTDGAGLAGIFEQKFDLTVGIREDGVLECEPLIPLMARLIDFTRRVIDLFDRYCFAPTPGRT